MSAELQRPSAATVVPRAMMLSFALVGFLALGSGQALASHVSCGDTITTDTKLDSDLTDCPSSGVVIGAGDIELDLNGHTIDGDGVGFEDERGVDGGAFAEVEVKGPGVVREFGTGVFVFGEQSVVRGLRVSGPGGIVCCGDDGSIRENTVSGTGMDVNGSRVHVERNVVSDSPGEGIALHSNFAVVRNNTVSSSGAGIMLSGGPGHRIEGNSVFFNGVGIYVLSSETGVPGGHNQVKHNSAFENATGIVIEQSDDNVVRKNSTYDNVIGIGVVFANDNTVEGNSASGNAEDGISVSTEFGESTGTLIERNHTNGNGDDGIDVDSPATTLTKNTANDNGDLGIEAVLGVTDGGGNKARRNGSPVQCTNVACK